MSCAADKHVAQVVVDAGDRHAELGQALSLREFVRQRLLHAASAFSARPISSLRPLGAMIRETSCGRSPNATMFEVSLRTGRSTMCHSVAQTTMVITTAMMTKMSS